ncbi:MAG: hypothetical protein WCD89_10485 [Anaerocolumna sp.]
MNNWCNRKCTWNFDNRCYPETDSHFKDGTVYTNNCTEFLKAGYFERMEKIYDDCRIIILNMPLEDLKKVRYTLKQIKEKKETIVCGGYCRACKNKTLCEAIRQGGL